VIGKGNRYDTGLVPDGKGCTLGFLDWLVGRRKKRSRIRTARAAEPEAVRGPEEDEGEVARKIFKALMEERERTKETEKRLKEMERRFQKLQENWAKLVEERKQKKEIPPDTGGRQGPGKMEAAGPIKDSSIVGTGTGKAHGHGGDRLSRLSLPILEDKRFKNFVVDDSNRFPFLASEAVASGEGRMYNPLFMFGPVGVGKTHLLQAIANEMRERNPKLNVLYSSTERFTDELIRALNADDIHSFRELYQDVDVLLVDDIQMLSGREATQKEFFHMFNYLYNSGRQIVLCSDRPPSDIKELENRLRSRFEGGLIIDIQIPTFEGRKQILVNISQREGFPISTEVLDYLAFYLDSSVRELEGGFNRVTAYSTLMKEPVTVNLVRRVLEGSIQKKEILKKEESAEKDEFLMYTENLSFEDGSPQPLSDLDLEKETEKIEQELLLELKKQSGEPGV